MPHPDLVQHVAASTGLTPAEASRVIQDVIGFYRESVEEYVRRRHRELQAYGVRNPQAFARIGHELGERPVRSPDLSERQLRRIVYG